MTKTSVHAAASAAALMLWAAAAQSAGLGKLTVVSNLGEPFRAEIDLVAVKKEELGSLASRLASPDAFRQADLPYTAYVSNLKLSIEKRPSGEPFVKISSYQPLNEPFIDFLVELSWNSGRLVRAYTALVDPPSVTEDPAKTAETRAAARPVEPKAEAITDTAPPAAPAARAEPVKPAPEKPAPTDDGMISYVTEAEPAKPAKGAKGTKADKALAPEAPAAGGTDHKVKRGDTLSKIALAHKPADLTLDQMLVLLYRANPDAFDGKNMNRLKTGAVLRLPDASEAAELSAGDARKEVRAQTSSWNAYRERLAAAATNAPEKQESPARTDAGKVAPKVEEPAAPAPEAPKDVVKLSKGEPGKTAKPAEKQAAAAEDATAKAKAGKEADQRVAELEKNIKDMQSLMEMKNKGLTDAQKQAAAKPAEPTPAPAAPAKPAEAAPAPAASPAVDAASGAAAMPPAAMSGKAEPPEPLSGPAAAPTPPKRKFVPPPPPPPPSLVDEILGEPLYLAGGAAVLAAIGGLGWFGWKRRKSGGAGPALAGKAAAAAAGGSMATDLAAGDTITTTADDLSSDSDPLQEAEIFISYGRDNLAEERLRDGIKADPGRLELHAKLLELVAKRGDAAGFETVAKQLQQATGGQGAMWDSAAALGRSIDPGNPRYGGGGNPTATIPGLTAVTTTAVGLDAVADESATDLDFNLGMGDTTRLAETDLDLSATSFNAATETDIDLSSLASVTDPDSTIVDLGARLPSNEDTMQMAAFDPTALSDDTLGAGARTAMFDPSAPPTPPSMEDTLPGIPGSDLTGDDGNLLDFELDAPATPPIDLGAGAAASDDGGLTFDLTDLGGDTPAAAAPAAPDFDLSTISLDLGGGATSLPATTGERTEAWY
nr:hypothetical protein [Gemmatimonadaceae bacterium]